jgi:hypothetical protein
MRRPARPARGTSSASMTASTARAAAVASGWPAVGGGVIARLEGCGDVGLRPAGADGNAVAQGLGHRDHVGHHTEVLVAEPLPRAAEAGLHLVDHEEQTPLVAQPPHAWKYSSGGRVDAALALHGLEEHGRDRGIDGRLQGIEVVPRDVAEALGQGLERLVLLGLARWRAGWRACGRGTTQRADHDVAAPPTPPAGQLDGALVGFGPELAKNTWPPPPRSRSSVRATCHPGSVPKMFETCSSVWACWWSAAATAGWLWPRLVTARPERRSR